jgi:putative ABC transport system substrate-binding protein
MVAWPLAARSQQPAMPVIGYLSARSRDDTSHLIVAFQRGLADSGYVDGQNATIEYRFAEGAYEKLPAMAAELVSRSVAVIASTGGEPAALAAKAATSAIPIVFAVGGDPAKEGLVASFSRPGGNATGIALFTNELEPKRLALLHELLPQATQVGCLLNPSFPRSESQLADLQEAATAARLSIFVLRANSDSEIDGAFETIAQHHIPGLTVVASPFFDTRRNKLVLLAARNAVPTAYHTREFAESGGLMSYGINFTDSYRKLGVYAGRILKGEKPADLPVQRPTKFELVVNLKTAKSLGLTIPQLLLAQADEVIE